MISQITEAKEQGCRYRGEVRRTPILVFVGTTKVWTTNDKNFATVSCCFAFDLFSLKRVKSIASEFL